MDKGIEELKVKYDNGIFSSEDWLQMFQENKFIEKLLNGGVIQVEDQLDEPDEIEHQDLVEEDRDKVGKNPDYDHFVNLANVYKCASIGSYHEEATENAEYNAVVMFIEQDLKSLNDGIESIEMNWHHPGCNKEQYQVFMIWSRKKKK